VQGASHEQLAEALQKIALGRPADADEKAQATKADHIASAADRVNFPAGATAYWDQVEPTLTHPLAAGAQSQRVQLPAQNLQQLDNEVQEVADQNILQPWVDQLTKQPDKEKCLYFHIWRLLYAGLARQTKPQKLGESSAGGHSPAGSSSGAASFHFGGDCGCLASAGIFGFLDRACARLHCSGPAHPGPLDEQLAPLLPFLEGDGVSG
jgi:hypothetical protein